MPEEVRPDPWPVNSEKRFYGGHCDWAPLDIPDEEMADSKVVSWAEEQLSTKHDKPLFLAVGIYRPHVPWWTPSGYFDQHPIEKLKLPEVKEGDLDDVPAIGNMLARRKWQQSFRQSFQSQMI